MKKIFIVILICSSFSLCYAQSDKKLKKLTEGNAEQIDSLTSQNSRLATELNHINSIIAKIEKRSFSSETPEQTLKRRLVNYKSVEELSMDESDLSSRRYIRYFIIRSYLDIIEMYKSTLVNGGYNKEKNDIYKNEIGTLRNVLNNMEPRHKETFIDSFDELAVQIEDYQFTMSELLRIFVLVDEMTKKRNMDIYNSLKNDNEIDAIEKIPYTKEILERYINSNEKQRHDIRNMDVFKTIR